MDIKYSVVRGKDIAAYVDYIASLRILSFRNYPYLYAGDLEYEKEYLVDYGKADNGTLVLAKEEDRIIGFATGMALDANSEVVSDLRRSLENRDEDIEHFYFYGETIILPAYQKRGIYSEMMKARGECVKSMGYTDVGLFSVERDEYDTRQPAGYKSLDSVWRHLGFKKTNIVIHYAWPTIHNLNDVRDTENAMCLWRKTL